jgi:hypothetical protein
MKKIRFLVWAAVAVALLAACGGEPAAGVPATPAATQPVVAPTEPPSSPAPTETLSATPPAATRAGSEYVLLLPREAAVPAGWAMNPAPTFETRRPQPGDTYRFACQDLTARSIGIATVGYRSLEGLPSIHIEYVIYPTAEAAAAALADMRQAVDECAEFDIGAGVGATSAAFSALEFPAYGDAGFAAALRTDSPTAGALLTHMVKVRQGHTVIGINHANYDGEAPPDVALTESLVALAVGNLRGGPAAPGE